MIEQQGRNRPPGIEISDTNIDMFAASKSGRPVLERKAHPLFIAQQERKGVSFESTPSKYEGSRKGTLMNSPALDTYRGGQTQRALDSLAWINDKVFGGEQPEVVTDRDLADLTKVGVALPTYLVLRAENPVDRTDIPEEVANIFKSSTGLQVLAKNKERQGIVSEITAPSDVYTYADSRQMLIDGVDTAHSCAGPKALIVKSTDALVFGKGGVAERSVLNTLVPEDEVEVLMGYSTVLDMYHDQVSRYRDGEIPLGSIARTFPRLQDAMNETLGRDPSTAPPPPISDLVRLQSGDFVAPPGSMVREAHDELEKKTKLRVRADKLRKEFTDQEKPPPRGIQLFQKK